ncbi:flagellar basal-body rod protein FlgF [Parasulfuritortus cantonensis]|uniref:Flagellar basal-body rod protein FlgF n=1 Tax=Parasulfuritortus cantonensis TaxID=2528202 RepID=A0A4R1BEM8_9PROT|nr:flagellar basal-body rod protein FlgF [Parasulfuritortus cantonensis]TCJ15537.1 flagellar basal-body rod protein FlgF [Parasulfuritortus cantonensis]
MDRVVYVAMTGAREITRQQAAVSHNLANIATTGFKAELNVFRALPVVGDGARTRAFVLETTPATDFTPGALQHTGRALDVAVRGSGWIAVQDAGGQEAYTRMGDLQTSINGILQTGTGMNVMGDGGPIAVAPDQEILIASDGTVSTVPTGRARNSVEIAGRIKLVDPSEQDLTRGEDGLFRLKSGQPAQADANIRLAVGTLEGSNVNPAEALVNMISLARQFETQMRVLRTAEDNHKAGDKVLAK